jgi:peptidoglycan hydrolase CwlO-like protein
MDIVERLRQEMGGYTDVHLEKAEADMREAADEIERLRAENAVLLKSFENQQNKAKAALMRLEKGLNLL